MLARSPVVAAHTLAVWAVIVAVGFSGRGSLTAAVHIIDVTVRFWPYVVVVTVGLVRAARLAVLDGLGRTPTTASTAGYCFAVVATSCGPLALVTLGATIAGAPATTIVKPSFVLVLPVGVFVAWWTGARRPVAVLATAVASSAIAGAVYQAALNSQTWRWIYTMTPDGIFYLVTKGVGGRFSPRDFTGPTYMLALTATTTFLVLIRIAVTRAKGRARSAGVTGVATLGVPALAVLGFGIAGPALADRFPWGSHPQYLADIAAARGPDVAADRWLHELRSHPDEVERAAPFGDLLNANADAGLTIDDDAPHAGEVRVDGTRITLCLSRAFGRWRVVSAVIGHCPTEVR